MRIIGILAGLVCLAFAVWMPFDTISAFGYPQCFSGCYNSVEALLPGLLMFPVLMLILGFGVAVAGAALAESEKLIEQKAMEGQK